MKNANYTYSGWKLNGFLALLLNLLMLAGSVWNFVLLGKSEEFVPIFLIVAIALIIASIIMACGFMMLEPNEARVLTFFGTYKGTFYNTGYWWINPFMSAKKLSLRARNLNVNPIKVNDKAGNPILIGLVLVWKIKEDGAYKAVFEIDSPEVVTGAASSRMNVLENFVAVQSDSALRQVAGMYAYDENSNNQAGEITLRSGGEEINERLKDELNERLSMAGIEVMEARLNYLAYAPEIAAAMLRRQQADAIISAREKIVEGAVSMVKIALERLSTEEVVELDEERKAAMVSNLLVVLCADEAAQPVVNTGTLHN
ncbi:MAG: SPFH domain-containing protein [Bacteroidales bacterium]|nr:SPFH domain-containing protein [Bacteroidales bacterium]